MSTEQSFVDIEKNYEYHGHCFKYILVRCTKKGEKNNVLSCFFVILNAMISLILSKLTRWMWVPAGFGGAKNRFPEWETFLVAFAKFTCFYKCICHELLVSNQVDLSLKIKLMLFWHIINTFYTTCNILMFLSNKLNLHQSLRHCR